MPGVDDFSTSFSEEILSRLLQLGHEYGFDPLCSIEMEKFWQSQVATGKSSDDRLRDVSSSPFVSAFRRPEWIQGCEWPLEDGLPLVFLGQCDIPSNAHLNGETSVYAFVRPESQKIRVIIQRVPCLPY